MHDYDRDPAVWKHYAEGNARQARKRVSADVLFRDRTGRILLVDPSYKPDWDLPGGMAEANESPLATARREIREELGLELGTCDLLVVDWVAAHGPWDDLLNFLFDGGMLSDEQAAGLYPRDVELRSLKFVSTEDAAQLLRPYVWRRVEAGLGLKGGSVSLSHDVHTDTREDTEQGLMGGGGVPYQEG